MSVELKRCAWCGRALPEIDPAERTEDVWCGRCARRTTRESDER